MIDLPRGVEIASSQSGNILLQPVIFHFGKNRGKYSKSSISVLETRLKIE